MPKILHAPVTVQFGGNGEDEGSLIWERDSDRVSEDPRIIYLRLYPAQPEQLIVTSGTITSNGDHIKHHTDVLAFVGDSTEQSIQYPNVTSVDIEQLGTFYDLTGNPITVTFSYNETKKAVTVSEPCYGVIKLKYDAPYHSYIFSFSGPPCVIEYEEREGVGSIQYEGEVLTRIATTGGYTDTLILAVNYTEGTQATQHLQLNPATCGEDLEEDSTFSTNQGNIPPPEKLMLEVHKDFPPRITGNNGANNLTVSCKVRQIPAVNATIDTSSGFAAESSFVNSGSTYNRTTQLSTVNNYNIIYAEDVKEFISFTAGYSASLQYQPASTVKIVASGGVLDMWGNNVYPTFALPGEEITEVEWISEISYRNPRRRKVKTDEVVATISGGISLEVYGSVRAEYSITFKVYDVTFKQSSIDRPEDGWGNVHMLALFEDQTADLSITAPSIKEK